MDNEDKLLQDIVLRVIGTSGIIDKATSWASAGVGTSIVLIFSKIKDVMYEFGKCEVQFVLGLLLAALAFGITVKILYVVISIKSRIIKEVGKCMYEDHSETPLQDVSNVLSFIENDITRWYTRWYNVLKRKIFGSSDSDPLRVLLVGMGKNYNALIEFSFLMVLMIVLAIGFVIVNL